MVYDRAGGLTVREKLVQFFGVVFDWAFMMGVYGPLAVVVAAPLALVVARARRERSLSVKPLWIAIGLAVIATGVFYRFLLWSAPVV